MKKQIKQKIVVGSILLLLLGGFLIGYLIQRQANAESVILTCTPVYDTRYAFSLRGTHPSDYPSYLPLAAHHRGTRFSFGDLPVFCLEPWAPNVADGHVYREADLDSIILDSALRTRLSQIGYYGWVLSDQTLDDYFAVSYLLWQARGWDYAPSWYEGEYFDYPWQPWYLAKKNEIEQRIAEHTQAPSFAGREYIIRSGETLTLNDTAGVLPHFMRAHGREANVPFFAEGIRYSWDGKNSLSVLASVTAPDTVTLTLQNVPSEAEGIAVAYYNGDQQKLSPLNKINEPFSCQISFKIRKEGLVKARKINEQQIPLSGAVISFATRPDFSDARDYVSGEDGYTAEVCYPHGTTVYAREKAAPSGYLLNPEVHQVTVVADRTITFPEIVNRVPRAQIELLKRSAQSSSLISGAGFELTLKSLAQAEAENPDWRARVGQVVARLTTDANGTARVSDLPLGEYLLRETVVPPGYVGAEDQLFSIDYCDQHTASIPYRIEIAEQPVMGRIRLKKHDHETQNSLPDAVFEVTLVALADSESYASEWREKEGQVVATLRTDDQGEALSSILPLGTYRVKEAVAPNGYLPDPTEHELSLEAADTETSPVIAELICDNVRQKGILRVQKVDPVSGLAAQNDTGFADAVFDLICVSLDNPQNSPYQPGDQVCTLKTDDTGRLIAEELELGIYDLVERSAPESYELNQTAIRLALKANAAAEIGEQIQLSFNYEAALREINARIDAYNAYLLERKAMREPLPHYELKDPEKAFVDLPSGFALFFDRVALTRFELTKHLDDTDEDTLGSGERVPESDITFTVCDRNGSVVDTLRTNEFGFATTRLLPPGVYTFKQSSCPEGMIPVEDFQMTGAHDGHVAQIILANKPVVTRLKIVKTDSETGLSIPQANVSFEIFDRDLNPIVMTIYYPSEKQISSFRTDENGEVVLPQMLKNGTYFIRETKAPEGYYLDPEGEPFAIEVDGEYTIIEQKIKEISIPNQPQKGRLIIDKQADLLTGFQTEVKNVAGEEIVVTRPQFAAGYLGGIHFELRAAEDIRGGDGTLHYRSGELVEQLITKDDGPVTSRELPLGHYQLHETETLPGYLPDPEVYDLYFTEQDSNLRVDLQRQSVYNQKAWLKIRLAEKTFEQAVWHDYHQEAPDRTIFGLFNQAEINHAGHTLPAHTLLDAAALDKNLSAQFEVAFEADYYIKELRTHEAYNLAEPVDLSVTHALQDESGGVLTINPIRNELIKANVELLKIEARLGDDAEFVSRPLPGAVFRLIATNGGSEREVGRYSTDTDGKIVIENLEVGTYYLSEIKPPAGYQLNDRRIEFKLTDGTTICLESENEPTLTTISKLDSTGKQELNGASLAIYDANGRLVERWLSSDLPHQIKGLVAGQTYRLVEDSAPPGYRLSNDVIFTLNHQGLPIQIDMINQATEVTLVKTDRSTGMPVAGAKISISDGDGQTVATGITDQDGKIKVTGLAAGQSYKFTEIEAPQGYCLNPETYEWTFDQFGQVSGVTSLTNEPTAVQIYKCDDSEESKPLAGAKFKLVFADGPQAGEQVSFKLHAKESEPGDAHPAGTKGSLERHCYSYDDSGDNQLISDRDGLIELRYLPYGRYTLIEIEAPKGYQCDLHEYHFTVDATTGVSSPLKIKWANQRKSEAIPQTGEANPRFPIVSLVVLAAGACLLKIRSKALMKVV